jgi:hypothetical protein
MGVDVRLPCPRYQDVYVQFCNFVNFYYYTSMNKNIKSQPSKKRLTDSGLVWFNLLGVGPFLLGILMTVIASDNSQDIGAPIATIAFAPVALPVIAIDIYRFIKWQLKAS